MSENDPVISGLDDSRSIDAIFVNTPLKNYDIIPRYNNFTLPVLGPGYIATCAERAGLNIGILDAEALGLGISEICSLINSKNPRWVGLNLLAPTYQYSRLILSNLDTDIKVMLGGHQAKAMPMEILNDSRIPRVDALILGEGEYRAVAILENMERRKALPQVLWREKNEVKRGDPLIKADENEWMAPDINKLPFINRDFLIQEPYLTKSGALECSLVGSRGCPYNCSFCGAAISANPDISVRTRFPENIAAEMEQLSRRCQVNAFRFVDDLFLANPSFIEKCLSIFKVNKIGERFTWSAAGRINILSRISDRTLELMKETGCREISLGIESSSERLLKYMGKRISPEMTLKAVQRITRRGINVKGYFILGFPTETGLEFRETIDHIRQLWRISDGNTGEFRCSVFEFRPYPGTPEWNRLLAGGEYSAEQLLQYEHVDLTETGQISEMLERDEFNFSVNLQFGEVPVPAIRQHLREIMIEQKQRLRENGGVTERL